MLMSVYRTSLYGRVYGTVSCHFFPFCRKPEVDKKVLLSLPVKQTTLASSLCPTRTVKQTTLVVWFAPNPKPQRRLGLTYPDFPTMDPPDFFYQGVDFFNSKKTITRQGHT